MPNVSFLADVLIFLLAAVIVGPILQRLKSSLVVGYLVAGIIVGTHGLGLVEESDIIHGLGELGVIFLLFTIGLELNIDRLRLIRAYVFGLGSLQVVLTALAIGGVAMVYGLTAESALIVGGGLALSSTAVVLQLLSERGEMASRASRVAFSILIFQDLAVVPLLALVPSLSGDGGGILTTVLWTVVKAAIALGGIVAVGRLLLRPLLRMIAVGHSPEMFAAITLVILLGAAWATAQFGLSLAIGGFVAGLLLSESEFRHQVAAEIAPFRGLLLGLFFITVGMGIDLGYIAENIGVIAALVAALIAGKSLIIFLLSLLFRVPAGPAANVGLLLGQGGEFGFIVFALATAGGLIEPDFANLMVVVIAVGMTVTPLLAAAGARIQSFLQHKSAAAGSHIAEEADDLTNHVIVAGFGRVGQSVCKTLAAAGVPYIALEFEPTRVAEARAQGLPVFYADAGRPEVFRTAGAERARAAVIIMDNAHAAERAVSFLHHRYPNLRLIVRARDNRHRNRLAAAGATGIVHETYELSLQLGGTVLRNAGVTEEEILRITQEFRADDYAALADIIHPAERDGRR